MILSHPFGVASGLARSGPDVLGHVVHDAEGLSDIERLERDDGIVRFLEDVAQHRAEEALNSFQDAIEIVLRGITPKGQANA